MLWGDSGQTHRQANEFSCLKDVEFEPEKFRELLSQDELDMQNSLLTPIQRKKLVHAFDCCVHTISPNMKALEFDPENTPKELFNRNFKEIVLEDLQIRTRLRKGSIATTTYVYKDEYWQPFLDNMIKKQIGEWMDFYDLKDTKNSIEDIFDSIKRETQTEDSEFNVNSEEINLENGILNLSTGKFEKHTPEKLHTKRIPMIYDPKAKCPKIDKFLSEVFKKEDQTVLRQFCGLCLTDLMIYQKAFMLYGDGHNGKTTFISLQFAMVGEENSVNMDLKDFGKGHKSASLEDKTLVYCSDIDATYKISIRNFKQYVGNESRILVDPKHIQSYQIKPTAKLVFSCNTKMPEVPEDTDKGFWRKWIILECSNDFSEKGDEKMLEKITTKEELSGFLNECIAGLQTLMKNGKFDDKYYNWIEVKDFWLSKSELVNDFIDAHCVTGVKEKVRSDDFYLAYIQWLKTQNKPPVTKTKLTQQLSPLGYNKARKRLIRGGNQESCYVGLALKPNGSDPTCDAPDPTGKDLDDYMEFMDE